MQSFYFTNRFSELATVYTITLLIIYLLKPNAFITLTTRTSFRGWSGVQYLFDSQPRSVSWDSLSVAGWCPNGNHTSPQCGCFERYYFTNYIPTNRSWNGTNKAFSEKHSVGILQSCLRERPSWKKETCGDFCKLHLLTPLLLSCLYVVCFYSKIVAYESRYAYIITQYLPFVLASAVVISQLVREKSGAIVATTSVISVLLEVNYFCSYSFEGQIYWSFHRFFTAALAVQAALLNEARDLIQVFSYGMLGFFAGLLSYMIYLVRQGIPCKHDSNICLHMWLGVCSIASSFIFLVQQSWMDNSPLRSNSIVNLSLLIACVQCVLQTPFVWVPTEVHMSISFSMITLCFSFLIFDIFNT